MEDESKISEKIFVFHWLRNTLHIFICWRCYVRRDRRLEVHKIVRVQLLFILGLHYYYRAANERPWQLDWKKEKEKKNTNKWISTLEWVITTLHSFTLVSWVMHLSLFTRSARVHTEDNKLFVWMVARNANSNWWWGYHRLSLLSVLGIRNDLISLMVSYFSVSMLLLLMMMIESIVDIVVYCDSQTERVHWIEWTQFERRWSSWRFDVVVGCTFIYAISIFTHFLKFRTYLCFEDKIKIVLVV